MRLSDADIRAIVSVLSDQIGSNDSCELRLFGSRTNDDARGGDIDLMLILSNAELRSKLAFNKAHVLAEIKGLIGEQKIDLVLTTREQMALSAFQRGIYQDSVLLKQW